VRDHEVRPFTDRQIDLLKTFADQFARLLGLEQPRILNADLVTLTQERDAEDRPIVASALCLVKGIFGVSQNVRDLHWLPFDQDPTTVPRAAACLAVLAPSLERRALESQQRRAG